MDHHHDVGERVSSYDRAAQQYFDPPDARLKDEMLLANESGELFPCEENGHDGCAISPGGRCLGEEWALLAAEEYEPDELEDYMMEQRYGRHD